MEEEDDTFVYIYDRRDGADPPVKVYLAGVFQFETFYDLVKEKLAGKSDNFVICTTGRDLIDDDNSYQDLVNANDTLYVLEHLHQELSAPAAQHVMYVPHHDTIVKSGMYEYYASEGQNPLSYAFAELVDNALSATKLVAKRSIEIQLVFDDNAGHSVYVIDNGTGMTTRKLNDWAIYRLSKQSRHHSESSLVANTPPKVPRFLNSNISYFGVGGKQAIFFIGSAVRMITREVGSDDVHELFLSKDSFDQKARDRVNVYTGEILNRPPGDAHHVAHTSSEHLASFVQSETERPNFTAVVITGVSPGHVQYLRYHFHHWCRQLAHIYHYYLHGPSGNVDETTTADTRRETGSQKKSAAAAAAVTDADAFKKIDIKVSLLEKGKPPVTVQLSEINDDLQTQFIRSSVSSFEFCAEVEGVGPVEGVLRYHPFHFDHETMPHCENPNDVDTDGGEPGHQKKAIFECYWNGRLIPYTNIQSLEWCKQKKYGNIPEECFRRISGVLWTDSHFQVSTNKLTFIDMPPRLQEKSTWYSRIIRGVEQRCGSMQRGFADWVKESHELFDKQVKFMNYRRQIKRKDLQQKRMQMPWSVFESIEWDGKVFQKGQLVRIQRVMPVVLGRVNHFLLYGDHEEGDVYATGGEIEIQQEPVSLYSETKIYPLSKLDRTCTTKAVEALIAEDERKLPARLDVTFPDGNAIKNNAKIPCDSILGAIGVEILNGHGDPMSKIVGERQKQLMVEQRIIHHTATGDKDIVKLCSRHGGKKWAYWFGAVEFRSVGNYTLFLQAIVGGSEGSTSLTQGSLPSVQMKFSVSEGKPMKFSVGVLDGPFRIGKPFQIPISLHDRLENRTPLPSGVIPALTISGMQVSFKDISKKGGECVINSVVIIGKVDSSNGKDVVMTVQIPSLDIPTQRMKIRLLPGPPSKLEVDQGEDGEPMRVESGIALELNVRVRDAAGNPASDNRMTVNCKLSGAPQLEGISAVASNGLAVLTCTPKVHVKNKKSVILKAVIDMPHHRSSVASVERRVEIVPSSRPASLQVFRKPTEEMENGDGETEQVAMASDAGVGARAGETLSGLTFCLLDEGGRNVEINNDVASKIRVNWVQKVAVQQLKQGMLPDIKVPSTVGELKFCQVSLASTPHTLEFSFSVVPLPGPVAELKCMITSNAVRVEEATTAPLIITLHDQQGNQVKKIDSESFSDISLTGPNLKSHNPPEFTDECIKIRKIVFTTTKIGLEDVLVKVGDLSAPFSFQMLSGKPTQVRILDCQPEEVFKIYNDGRLPIPLMVQLYDALGNPCALEGVRMQLGKSSGLKLSPPTQQQRTDSNGRVNFGFTSARAERGQYCVTPRAIYGQSTIVGGSLRISIEPDPSRVVALLISPVEDTQCSVGGILPALKCCVQAEDDQAFTGADPAHLKMDLLLDGNVVSSFSPSEPATQATQFQFQFSGNQAPLQSGIYYARFSYDDGSVAVQSPLVNIEVHPGPACSLVPDCLPSAVAVSNGAVVNQRKIVQNFELRLQDSHGNNCIDGSLSGTVHIALQPECENPRMTPNIPTFDGGTRLLSMPLVAGTCIIQRLVVAQDCPGEDGQRYAVNFSLECEQLRRDGISIEPFCVSFLFCNDGHKQRQLSSLTMEKDRLHSSIQELKQFFSKREEDLRALKDALQAQEQELKRLQMALSNSGFAAPNVPHDPVAVQHQIDLCRQEHQTLLHAPRRRCMLDDVPPHYANDRDVIGKVAHLAMVDDDNVARVLSWHMGNDMDCCITTTTEKAMSVNEQCGGRQQMLALDSIYKRALPAWDKQLPHARVLREPRGNPQFVKHYLKFSAREEECRQVFALLLGEVIVLDTLADAAYYRQHLAQHTRCPTLLTREGDRIRSTGKFGGAQNKAPPLDKLRVVFGAPPPERLTILNHQIEMLQSLQQQVSKMSQTKQLIQDKMDEARSAAFKDRERDCRHKEDEVSRIGQQIVILSPQPAARPSRPPGANVHQHTRGIRTRTPSHPTQTPAAKRRRY